MTTDLSPSGIQRLLEICEAATTGPWRVDKYECYIWGPNGEMVADSGGARKLPDDAVVRIRGVGGKLPISQNMAFIAAASTALPDALVAVERVTADCCALQSQLDAANEGAWEYERQLNAALKSLQEIADMRVGDQPAALAHYSEADWVRRHAVMMQHIAYTAVKAIVADEGAKPKPIETAYDIISSGLSDGTCAANIIDRLIEAGHLRKGTL